MEPPSTPSVTITGLPKSLESARDWIKECVRFTLSAEQSVALVEIHFASLVEMRELNGRYRGNWHPTDVLTFVDQDGSLPEISLAVSPEIAAQQARIRGVDLANEVAMLVIHGVLHGAGWNDETPDDQRRMLRRMDSIAHDLGIPSGLPWMSYHYDLPGGSAELAATQGAPV